VVALKQGGVVEQAKLHDALKNFPSTRVNITHTLVWVKRALRTAAKHEQVILDELQVALRRIA